MADVKVRILGEETVSDAANKANEGLGNLSGGLAKLLGAGAAVMVWQQLAETFHQVYAAAEELLNEYAKQEKAALSMAAALGVDKNATAQTVTDMHSWAMEMEHTYGIQHELIEQSIGYTAGMNLTEAQMKKLLTAAIALSSTGYVTLDEAVRGLVQAQETGTVGIIGRHIPALRELTKAQLEHGDAVNLAIQLYGKLPAVMANSTSGIQTRMSELIDEQKAKLGAAIADAYKGILQWRGAIDEIGTVAAGALTAVIKVAEGIVLLNKGAIDFIIGFGKVLIDSIVALAKVVWAPIEFAFHDTILSIKNAFIDAINWILTQLTDLAHKTGSIFSSLSGGVLGKGLQNLDLGQLSHVKDEGAKPLGDTFKQIWEDWKKNSADAMKPTLDDLKAIYDLATKISPTLADNMKSAFQATGGGTGGGGGGGLGVGLPKDAIEALLKLGEDQLKVYEEAEKERKKDAEEALKQQKEDDKMILEGQKLAAEAIKQYWKDAEKGKHGLGAAAEQKLGTTEVGQAIGNVGGNGSAGGLDAVLPGVISSFVQLFGSLSSVMAILNPLQTILKGVFQVLGPLVNTILQPIVGMLIIVGNTIGKVLAPIISAVLVPVIQFLSVAFVYLYNYGIMPLANAMIWTFNLLYDMVAYIWNAIADAINSVLGWLGVNVGTMSIRSLNSGFLSSISVSDLSQAGANGGNGGSSGGTASYGQAQPIYNTFNIYTGALVGDQSFDDFCTLVGQRMIQLGMLGRS
jgi:hypothetical protein